MAKTMSENAKKIMKFLQENGVGVQFTYKQVQEALGFEKTATVVGTITAQAKKGRIEKSEKEVEVDGAKKIVKCFALTQAGADFDPDAVVED